MQDDTQDTPTRVQWSPAFASGHADIDAQHQDLLARCDALAALFSAGDEARFDQAFGELRARVQAHFEAEATRLAAADPEALEDHLADTEEFGYLADEIATTAHFDRLELQRFAAVWCLGHVSASAQQLRELNTPR